MKRATEIGIKELTLEQMGDYADGVAGALEARPSVAKLEPPWTAFVVTLDDAERRKKKARRKLGRARKRLGVADGDFDDAASALSSETYHLAGKDAAKEPYVSYYGAVTAEDVKQYGPAKATAFGRTVKTKTPQVLAGLADDAARTTVQTCAADVEATATALAGAAEGREQSVTELTAFDTETRRLQEALWQLVVDTELGILTQHKGQRGLVDRILAIDHEPARKKKKKEPGPPK